MLGVGPAGDDPLRWHRYHSQLEQISGVFDRVFHPRATDYLVLRTRLLSTPLGLRRVVADIVTARHFEICNGQKSVTSHPGFTLCGIWVQFTQVDRLRHLASGPDCLEM